MRAATYSIDPVGADGGVAECIVNYFGPGQGGGVDANIERWKGQFRSAAPPKTRPHSFGEDEFGTDQPGQDGQPGGVGRGPTRRAQRVRGQRPSGA